MRAADQVSNEVLIDGAAAVLRPHVVPGYGGSARRLGHVAAALATEAGHLYTGVCIDTGSGTGFCAEHAAIAAMVTAGEYAIARIVAVWRDEDGHLFVLPPCGRCREFIRQIDPGNLDAEVVLGWTDAVRLRDLLPRSNGPTPVG